MEDTGSPNFQLRISRTELIRESLEGKTVGWKINTSGNGDNEGQGNGNRGRRIAWPRKCRSSIPIGARLPSGPGGACKVSRSVGLLGRESSKAIGGAHKTVMNDSKTEEANLTGTERRISSPISASIVSGSLGEVTTEVGTWMVPSMSTRKYWRRGSEKVMRAYWLVTENKEVALKMLW